MHHLAEHLCEKPELDVLVNMFHAAPGDSIINTIRNGIKDTGQNVVVWSRNDTEAQEISCEPGALATQAQSACPHSILKSPVNPCPPDKHDQGTVIVLRSGSRVATGLI